MVRYAYYHTKLIYSVLYSPTIYLVSAPCLHTSRLWKDKDEWERYGPCSHTSFNLVKIMMRDYRQMRNEDSCSGTLNSIDKEDW